MKPIHHLKKKKKKITKKDHRNFYLNFFYKNKHTYQIYFLCFLNTETRYLNYDTKYIFFVL